MAPGTPGVDTPPHTPSWYPQMSQVWMAPLSVMLLKSASLHSGLLNVCDTKLPPSPARMHKDSRGDSGWAPPPPPPLRGPLVPQFLIKRRKGAGNRHSWGLPVSTQSLIMGQRLLGSGGFSGAPHGSIAPVAILNTHFCVTKLG